MSRRKPKRTRTRPAGKRVAPRNIARLKEAINLHRAGRFVEAEAGAREVLAEQPDNADALNLLGSIAAQTGRWAEAGRFLAHAASLSPANPYIHFNLGRVRRELGEPGPAQLALEKALQLKPDLAPAAAELGDLFRDEGMLVDATSAYRRAVELESGLASAWNNLGNVLRRTGQTEAAVAALRSALKAQPDFAEAYANLGLALRDLGNVDESIAALQQAIHIDPDRPVYWQGLAAGLHRLKHVPRCPGLREDILACLDKPFVNHNHLASTAFALLAEFPGFHLLLEAADEGAVRSDTLDDEMVQGLLADDLLRAVLTRIVVRDVFFERLLTQLRRMFLLRLATKPASDVDPTGFLPVLAAQCYLNEYVWFESPEEAQRVRALERQIEDALDSGARADPSAIAILGSYRPLYRTGLREPLRALDRASPGDSFAMLLREQVDEPVAELALQATVATLGGIEDATSRRVRAQYEENPYPRWKSCDVRQPRPLRTVLAGALSHVSIEELPNVAEPEVLIAGCGTGLQTMRVASTYAGASILAVDLSLSSIAYSARKTDEYGVSNVQYLQADILNLGGLERQFDVIESFGVLHHMRDPVAGLGVLAGLLKPGGVMLLGIYSEIARAPVVAAREFIAGRNYRPTPDGIRQCRQDLFSLSDRPEFAAITSPASDFWTMSDCRDLIFHVNEHRYTLLQLDVILRGLELEFLGLVLPDEATRRAFQDQYPARMDMRSLGKWHDFETAHPETFGDTYRFWVKKKAPAV